MPTGVDVGMESPLASRHSALGATMTDFAGWSMPVRYSSDIGEHLAVRSAAGLFDVSHMGEIYVNGEGAAAALSFALVGDMRRLEVGRAKYTMMCASDGGVVDDLIVYRTGQRAFMVVANAGNAAVVAAELRSRCADFSCDVDDASARKSLIAVQGPESAAIVRDMTRGGGDELVAGLRYYAAASVTVDGESPALVGRTGYTGEDGYEFFVAVEDASKVWDSALAHGAARGLIPCGLAARDTLRLEAGMPLYGHELGPDTTPFDAGLGRVVHFGDASHPRGDFVGRAALELASTESALWAAHPESAPGPARTLVGLIGDGKRAARSGYGIRDSGGASVGLVTSGAPSPSLGRPIAMAYVHPRVVAVGSRVVVDVRGRGEDMRVTALPFYQRQREGVRGA